MAKNVITPKGRLSYPHLFERHTKGDYPSNMYETLFLIPKTTDISDLRQTAEDLLQEAFLGKIKSIDDLEYPPIRDGDDYNDDRKGHWFLKCKTDNRPQIVGANPENVIDDVEEVYGGRWAKLSLSIYSYNKAGKKGISWGLRNVQLLDHGDKFGGGVSDPKADFATEETTQQEIF